MLSRRASRVILLRGSTFAPFVHPRDPPSFGTTTRRTFHSLPAAFSSSNTPPVCRPVSVSTKIEAARTSGYQSGLRDGYQRALADITHDAAERASIAVAKPTISRTGPEWKAAMAASGTKIGLAMGLYMDGEISVGGRYAVTKVRVPMCKRCRDSGKKECRVVDPRWEVNLVTRMCGYCLRSAQGCVD